MFRKYRLSKRRHHYMTMSYSIVETLYYLTDINIDLEHAYIMVHTSIYTASVTSIMFIF